MARVDTTGPGAEALAEDAMNVSDDREGRRGADGADTPDHGPRQARKPYRRPEILSREVWESVAGVCSGLYAKSTMPPCQGPISS